MFYLVHENKIVDKAFKSFPVHPSLEWIENDEDVAITGNEYYVDGKINCREEKKDIAEIKASAEDLLNKTMIKYLLKYSMDIIKEVYKVKLDELNSLSKYEEFENFQNTLIDDVTKLIGE